LQFDVPSSGLVASAEPQYALPNLARSGEPPDLAEGVFFRFAGLGGAISIHQRGRGFLGPIHSLQYAFRQMR
jgi:hypothetical protein